MLLAHPVNSIGNVEEGPITGVRQVVKRCSARRPGVAAVLPGEHMGPRLPEGAAGQKIEEGEGQES